MVCAIYRSNGISGFPVPCGYVLFKIHFIYGLCRVILKSIVGVSLFAIGAIACSSRISSLLQMQLYFHRNGLFFRPLGFFSPRVARRQYFPPLPLSAVGVLRDYPRHCGGEDQVGKIALQ